MSKEVTGDIQEEVKGTEARELTLKEIFDRAKANYFIIKNAIDHREEPLETMKDLSHFIERVVENPNIFGDDKQFKDFFYQDCALGLLKRLNKERSADPEVNLNLAQI